MSHPELPKLDPLPHFKGRPGPLLLVILDGIGIGQKTAANAFYSAKTPHLDRLLSGPLYREIKAHGTAVGMPSDEDMGNSEVGHNALGAGRIFPQGATLVKQAVETRTLFEGKSWQQAIHNVTRHDSTLHFIGLLSDGNVHSHISHLIAMIDQAADQSVQRLRCHILLDGRDVGEKTALEYIEKLDECLARHTAKGRDYAIASGGGRMVVTMDRYNADWSIVERGWNAHVLGQAERRFSSAHDAIETFYAEDPSRIDQYLPPFVIEHNGEPVGPIVDHDSVICFNFRGDRVIELSMAFEQDAFDKFDRQRRPDIYYAGMMQYDGDLNIPANYLVAPPDITHPISYYLCGMNIRSFALSETQKFGHVTYFWNGNNSGYVDPELETYIEIPSDTIPFDQKPEMKAREITDSTIDLLESGNYKFARINFPNGDMVGHTGSLSASIKACEVTDECVGRLVETVDRLNGVTILLADHGNCDEMYAEKNGQKISKTAHTLNPVPFRIVDAGYNQDYTLSDVENPGLANVAATICNLLGYHAPADYEPSLISVKT